MRWFRVVSVAVLGVGLCHGQPPKIPNDLQFEVVTLKPSAPGGRGGGIRPAPGGERYVASNAPLRLMITVAYGVKGDQIAGGPDWMDNDRFDMNGKAERPSTVDELHVMLQNLLAERFKLKFHRETKEMPVYAITVDKSGPKLKANVAQNAGQPWIDVVAERMLQMKLHATVITMNYFAFRLSQMVDRPVIDLTKLIGSYDFDLAYTREPPPGMPEGAVINGEPVDTSGPRIFEAIRQQLGLKLEPQKGPVEIIVIDHVEKPAEN